MKASRLVAVSMLLASMAAAAPSFAEGQQPEPGPHSAIECLLNLAAYGIEMAGALL